jgi:hypothetical protein
MSGPELDGGAHGLTVIGIGAERFRPAVAEESLDEGIHSSSGHF